MLSLGDDLDLQLDTWNDVENLFVGYEHYKFEVSKTKTSIGSGII